MIFSLALIATTYYFDVSFVTPRLFWSLLIGILIYFIIPNRFYFNLAGIIEPYADNSEDYLNKIKETTEYKLNAFADSFERLGKTFSNLAEKRDKLEKKDITILIDDVADKVCTNCANYQICWEK